MGYGQERGAGNLAEGPWVVLLWHRWAELQGTAESSRV